MVKISKVKFRKYARIIVLRRRNVETFPENSVKYIHKSAKFAEMISNIGIERIDTYVRSMAAHSAVLAEMINTGFIIDPVLATEVESITQESERANTDLALIGNSLIRFIHTDSERMKSSRRLKIRTGKILTPENERVAPVLTVPASADAPGTVFAACDIHE